MSDSLFPDHASQGGLARAKKLSPEERSEIARAAVAARWERQGIKPPPVATHTGKLKIGELEIDCAVLENGERVLSQRTFLAALGIKKGGKLAEARTTEGGGALPLFVAHKSLRPFIDNDLMEVLQNPLKYVPQRMGTLALGLKASLIPRVCNVWLKARDAGALRGQATRAIATKADILLRGLGEVGIVALIDEATGYQDVRARDALAQILEAFVAKELRKWLPTFRPEFFREMYRLRGWAYNGTCRRPSLVGKLTDDIVYKRLAPGVRDELRRKNPVDEKGRRRRKHFQWLTDDTGYPALKEHLKAVTTLMSASDDWPQFMKMIDRALPRQPGMPLFEESKGDAAQPSAAN